MKSGLPCVLTINGGSSSIRFAADSADAKLLSLDGQEISGKTIPLRDDRREHAVEMKVR